MFFRKKKKQEQAKKDKLAGKVVQVPVLFSFGDPDEKFADRREINETRGIIIDINKRGFLALKIPSDIKHLKEGQMKVGRGVHVRFNLPTSIEPINATGVIDDINEKDKIFEGMMEISVRFQTISFLDLVAIEEFVEEGMEAADDTENRNKREFARFPVNLPAVFSDLPKRYISKEKARILNVSAAGVLLAKEKSFFSEELLEMLYKSKIKTLDVSFELKEKTKPVQVKGAICRVSEGYREYADFICIGLKFVDITEETQRNIVKFVVLNREKLFSE